MYFAGVVVAYDFTAVSAVDVVVFVAVFADVAAVLGRVQVAFEGDLAAIAAHVVAAFTELDDAEVFAVQLVELVAGVAVGDRVAAVASAVEAVAVGRGNVGIHF